MPATSLDLELLATADELMRFKLLLVLVVLETRLDTELPCGAVELDVTMTIAELAKLVTLLLKELLAEFIVTLLLTKLAIALDRLSFWITELAADDESLGPPAWSPNTAVELTTFALLGGVTGDEKLVLPPPAPPPQALRIAPDTTKIPSLVDDKNLMGKQGCIFVSPLPCGCHA